MSSTPPEISASILNLDDARETQALFECLLLADEMHIHFGRNHAGLRSLILRLTFCLRHRRLLPDQDACLTRLVRELKLDLASSQHRARGLLPPL